MRWSAIVLLFVAITASACGRGGGHTSRSAQVELAAIQQDDGFGAEPPGAELLQRTSNDRCSDPGFDRNQPFLSRTFRVPDRPRSALQFMARRLSAAGWNRGELTPGMIPDAIFHRDFGAWSADVILWTEADRLFVEAILTDPDFCS